MLCNPTPSARKVASLINTLEVARPSIWQPPFPDRSLQINLIKYLKASHRNYETSVHLNSHTQTEPLRRWFQKLTPLDGIVINSFDSDLYITSDASKAGWSSCCQELTTNQTSHKRPRTQSCYFRNESLSQTHMSNIHKRIQFVKPMVH